MKSDKPFVGFEAEGPHRGAKLLFVPGCVEPTVYTAAMLAVGDSVEGVYFGAGGYRTLHPETLRHVIKHSGRIVMIETETTNRQIIVVSWKTGKVYQKFENETITIWSQLPDPCFVTVLQDILYAADQEVKL